MEITLLLKSILGLVVVLALLIFLLFLPSSKKKEKGPKQKASSGQTHPNIDFKHLIAIIKDKKSRTIELKESLDLIVKYHGTIHKKLGLRTHPDFETYRDILFTICRHPNTSKDVVIKFDRALSKLNPEYKKEINEAITKGLNSRRV